MPADWKRGSEPRPVVEASISEGNATEQRYKEKKADPEVDGHVKGLLYGAVEPPHGTDGDVDDYFPISSNDSREKFWY